MNPLCSGIFEYSFNIFVIKHNGVWKYLDTRFKIKKIIKILKKNKKKLVYAARQVSQLAVFFLYLAFRNVQ